MSTDSSKDDVESLNSRFRVYGLSIPTYYSTMPILVIKALRPPETLETIHPS